MRTLTAAWLGRMPYAEAFAFQGDLHARRTAGGIGDTLLQLEHPPVYTIGRRGSRGEILWDEAILAERGVDVVETDRGGMVTFHGPGQLVGYPIISLGPAGDLIGYLRDLEEALIRTLRELGIDASRDEGHTGVWVGEEKIAAIGVRVTRGVTKHGFALNVSTDLSYFSGIVPCGIFDRGVTSIAALNGDAPPLEEAASVFQRAFAEVFGYEVVPAELPGVVAR